MFSLENVWNKKPSLFAIKQKNYYLIYNNQFFNNILYNIYSHFRDELTHLENQKLKNETHASEQTSSS